MLPWLRSSPKLASEWCTDMFDIVEKKAPCKPVHASFDTQREAERFLRDRIPVYVTQNSYCIREGLRAEDFEVVEA